MKYKRTKPNHEPWKRRPVPREEAPVPDHIEETIQRIETMLAPIIPVLQAMSISLDEMCATDGHNWRNNVYPDRRAICAACGRLPSEVDP